MQCDACGHENADNALFCEACKRPFDEERFHTPFLKKLSPVGTPDHCRIYVQDTGATFPVKLDSNDRLVIGRGDDPTPEPPAIDLAAYDARNNGVSRRHAQIERQENALFIEDLESKNSTYVNGQRLAPHVRQQLRDGDEVRLGNLRLILYFNFEQG